MITLVTKEHGLFNLKALYTLLRASKDGIYTITVRRKRKARTNDQNGWLWGCIYPLLLEALLDAGWEYTSVEQVHEFFKGQCLKDSVVNRDTGEIVEFPASTAIMDTITFSTYIQQLRQYAAEYLNLDIPDPDKDWRV